MRMLALLVAGAFLAGCIEAPLLDPSSTDVRPANGAPADEPTFCDAPEGCAFWDEDYHEYVLYDVDTPALDVLIVPSASPDAADDTRVIEAAVLAWADGIRALGAPWLSEGMAISVYVLGRDAPPRSALDDPEIVVLAAEHNPALIFGIGLEPSQSVCGTFGERTLRAYPVHSHSGMKIEAASCTGLGFVCFAVNANPLLGSTAQLHDLVAHEFGHCLGAGHVGDALDFRAKYVPTQDIMSYQHDPAQVHCVSNLNVRVLEGLYGPLLGAVPEVPLTSGAFYTMPRAAYAHVPCANP